VAQPCLAYELQKKTLVLLTLEHYALTDHILSDVAPPSLPSWCRMDCVVFSWLFGTLTIELPNTVCERGGTTRDAWPRY
jgi:hypothetical protein